MMNENTANRSAGRAKSIDSSTMSPEDPAMPGVKLREKLAYATGEIGTNMINAPVTSFVLFYFTNIAGIGAAIAGTILLIGQLLNGVTDLIVGIFIDKTHTRWGKARPWILWTALPFALSGIALFSVPPGLDETGKIIWATVTYALVMAVFFTASNVAYGVLVSVMTPNPHTRVALTSFRFFFALVTTLVLNVVTLPIVESLGDDQSAWTSTMTLFGVISVVTLLVVFVGTKERVTPPADDPDSSVKKPLGYMVKSLFKNRYFLLIAGLFVTYYLITGVSGAAAIYYATTVLGSASLFGIISIVGIAPAIIGIPFMPALMRRFGKRQMLIVGVALITIGSVIVLLAGTNLTAVIIGLAIRGLGNVPMIAGQFALVADVVDYGEWKEGVRADGLYYSAVTFGQKVGLGFGSAIAGWVLAIGGYDALSAVQTDAAVTAINAVFVWLPILFAVLTGIFAWLFNIEKFAPQVQDYLRKKVAQHPAE